MAEEEEDKFIKENPIVFKKYKVKKKLGEGAFGDVYLGQTIENNQYVALKVEPRKIIKPILESEAFLLYSIAGLGIPEVKSFGKVKNYNVLVEPLLGKSLFDIFAENHKRMPIEDVCLIGKQVIDRIQWVHSKYIVHRDIKPDNFLIGKKDPNVIYLIDFGLSKKYRSTATNKHIRFGFTGKLTGTVRFASANALRGGEQSRRDDIESIGYMLVYFLKQRLPWQGVTGAKKMERYLKIYKLKKNTTPEELCGDIPEMVEYLSYAKKLEFEQEPNYNYLRKIFKKMLKRVHNTNDQLVFSWITDVTNLKNPVNPATRRDSPQSRIYKKIKSNLERERNLSSESDSKHGSYQQVMTQSIAPTSNLKVVNKNINFTESEFEQKTEKKINKKALKAKEGLNTTIANLDATVDENVVDFENQKLKNGSKDTGEYINNISKFNHNSIYNSNNNFDNELSEKKKIMINKIPNDLYRNLNSEFNEHAKILNINDINHGLNDLDLEHLNKQKSSPDDNNPITSCFNTNPDDNINLKSIDYIEKNDIIKKNSKEINNINNDINNNEFNSKIDSKQNNKIEINNIDNDILAKNNSLFDYENKNELKKFTENQNKSFKNNLPKIDNNIIKNNNINNENLNIKLKSSNFEGKEFTFNEPIDFKSSVSNNAQKIKQDESKEIQNNINNEERFKVIEENKNNDKNIYALLTGNNNYPKNNINVKKQNIKKKNLNIDNIEKLDEEEEYLRENNLITDNNKKSNNINKVFSPKNKAYTYNNENENNKNNKQSNQSRISQKQNNIINSQNIKKNVSIKRLKKPTNNMNYKSKINKGNNIRDLRNQKSKEIKNNNNNIDISKQIYNELNNKTFPNDNDFGNDLIGTYNTINKANQKLINSEKKGTNQEMSKPILNNDDFFNECNNDLFDYSKKENNENDFSNTFSRMDEEKKMFNYMNNEIENNNLKYRGSNYNFGNNKNTFNYGYINIKDNYNKKNTPKKILNRKIIDENNLEKISKMNNNNTYYKDILKIDDEKMKINVSNNLKNSGSLNDQSYEFNKLNYIKKFNAINNNEQKNEENKLMNINIKNNYISRLGSKDNSANDKNNMINKKNVINNNYGNNARIVNLQPKGRKSPGNQQKINKRNIQGIKQIQSNAYNQQIIANSINDSNNLNQINNYINNNLNTNLINNNISNRQQINYLIPGYVNNNIINKQYNMQYMNSGRNIRPQIVNANPILNQKKLIAINPNKSQQGLNTGFVGTIPQQIGIQYNKVIPNNINPYGNIQYNMLGSSNIYPYQQNRKYQVSLNTK